MLRMQHVSVESLLFEWSLIRVMLFGLSFRSFSPVSLVALDATTLNKRLSAAYNTVGTTPRYMDFDKTSNNGKTLIMNDQGNVYPTPYSTLPMGAAIPPGMEVSILELGLVLFCSCARTGCFSHAIQMERLITFPRFFLFHHINANANFSFWNKVFEMFCSAQNSH